MLLKTFLLFINSSQEIYLKLKFYTLSTLNLIKLNIMKLNRKIKCENV